ncbi:Vesicle membrane receptor protein (v-SNARE) [Sorochytrium milnesiophthora]
MECARVFLSPSSSAEKPRSLSYPPHTMAANNNKTQQVQAQVNEVVGIMQNNIEKVMERGEKLDSLATKTEDLQQSSLQFKRGATKVRKAMWWKDLKLKLMIAFVLAVILAVIIVPIVNSQKSSPPAAPATNSTPSHTAASAPAPTH